MVPVMGRPSPMAEMRTRDIWLPSGSGAPAAAAAAAGGEGELGVTFRASDEG